MVPVLFQSPCFLAPQQHLAILFQLGLCLLARVSREAREIGRVEPIFPVQGTENVDDLASDGHDGFTRCVVRPVRAHAHESQFIWGVSLKGKTSLRLGLRLCPP